jgi:phage terminase Nu1 subunit (DNA packaging protein)
MTARVKGKGKAKSKAKRKPGPKARVKAKGKPRAKPKAKRKPGPKAKARVKSKAKRKPRPKPKVKDAAPGVQGSADGGENKLDALEAEAIREAAERAFQKQREGRRLSQQDLHALRRYEAWRRLEAFYEVAKALPQHVLVDLLGSPKKMLLEWQEAGMPRNTDRRRTYDLFAVVGWLKARWLKNPDADAARLSSDARTRLHAAKASRAELELAAQRGELVAVSDVAAEAGALAMRVRNHFLAMPAKLAGRLEGLDAASIERTLDGEVRDGLTELADRWGEPH